MLNTAIKTVTSKSDVLHLLYSASEAQYGIVVTCQDARSLYSRLTTAMRAEEHFDGLAVRLSPDDPQHEVWIVKRELLNAKG